VGELLLDNYGVYVADSIIEVRNLIRSVDVVYNHNEAREPGLLRNPVIPNILALRRPRLHQHERKSGFRTTKLLCLA